jgi:hypothetical protein
MNTYDVTRAMSNNRVCKRISRTYRWWDLCYCGKEEPHDTLVDRKQINGLRASKPGNGLHPTCFQRTSPTPNVPPPSRRQRNNPTSTVRSKTISVVTRTMILSLLLSELSVVHCRPMGSQPERSCGWMSLKGPRYWELLIHLHDT